MSNSVNKMMLRSNKKQRGGDEDGCVCVEFKREYICIYTFIHTYIYIFPFDVSCFEIVGVFERDILKEMFYFILPDVLHKRWMVLQKSPVQKNKEEEKRMVHLLETQANFVPVFLR